MRTIILTFCRKVVILINGETCYVTYVMKKVEGVLNDEKTSNVSFINNIGRFISRL